MDKLAGIYSLPGIPSSPPPPPRLRTTTVYSWWNRIFFYDVWRCLTVFDGVWRRFDRRFRGNWRPMIQIYFFLRYYKCCDWFGLIGDGLKESDLFGIYTFRLVSLLSYIMVRSYSLLYRNMLFLVWFDSIWRKSVVSLGFIRIYFLYHQRSMVRFGLMSDMINRNDILKYCDSWFKYLGLIF